MDVSTIAAPSVLACDFANITAGLETVHSAGARWIHLDVMDGHFVPNISFGPQMVQDIRKRTKLTLDVHLMISNPEQFVGAFADAGADLITFHIEAATHAHRVTQMIRHRGCRPGIAIVPSTPISAIEELLPELDLVLVMTVNPGFGGQAMIPSTLDKVRRLASRRAETGGSYRISVDGGINHEAAPAARDAGASVLVSGSAFFSSDNPAGYLEILEGRRGTVA